MKRPLAKQGPSREEHFACRISACPPAASKSSQLRAAKVTDASLTPATAGEVTGHTPNETLCFKLLNTDFCSLALMLYHGLRAWTVCILVVTRTIVDHINDTLL